MPLVWFNNWRMRMVSLGAMVSAISVGRRYRFMGSSMDSKPACSSCKMAVATIVLVILPTLNCVVGVALLNGCPAVMPATRHLRWLVASRQFGRVLFVLLLKR